MNFKKFLENKGISETDFEAKSAEEVQNLEKEYINSLQKNISDLNAKLSENSTKEELDAIKSDLNTYSEAIKNFGDDKFENLNKELKAIKEDLSLIHI